MYIYHAKSRLNTPVWGSLRSPNNISREISIEHPSVGLASLAQLIFFFFFFFSRQNRILSRKQILTYIGRVGPKEADCTVLE